MRCSPLSIAAPIILGAILVIAMSIPASAQVSAGAFTYQGELKDDDVGVNAEDARFNFRLWDAEEEGQQIGGDCEVRFVDIVDGVFTALVDFGEDAFDESERWLEIGVDPTGGLNYTWMTPRQRLTPAPMAVHALHGGDNPWTIAGINISYTAGKVGIGTTTPDSKLHVIDERPEPIIEGVSLQHGEEQGTAIRGQVDGVAGFGVVGAAMHTHGDPVGVYGETWAGEGIGVKGHNQSSSGSAVGVFGSTENPDGYAGFFTGRGYFGDRVGIGVPNATEMLEVNGAVKMRGFELTSLPEDGYVLTSDAEGVGTWEPALSGGSLWESGSGTKIYYDAGKVGVGTNDPTAPLHVNGTGTDPVLKSVSYDGGNNSGSAIYGELGATNGNAIHGAALSTDGQVAGVYGEAHSPSGFGVRGHNGSTPGGGAGVFGSAQGGQSSAVLGIHLASSGYGKGVFGRSDSPQGFGGYFMGRSYFGTQVGIGVTNPSEALDVNGTVKMSGFTLNAAPQSGYVLTSDASGNGAWQPSVSGAGLWEPGSGTQIYYNAGNVGVGTSTPSGKLHVNAASTTPVFKVISYDGGNDQGTAIYGELGPPNGFGVHGTALSTDGDVIGVLGDVCSSSGYGVKGYNWGTPGGGAGVYGAALGENSAAIMGLHLATSGSGKALLARTDSPLGYAGYFMGRSYFSDKVGIGVSTPSEALDVNGTVKMSGFELGAAPQSGYVLTSDIAGIGTWQPAADGLWESGTGGAITYNGGNVGIGVGNPNAPLQVNGEISSSTFLTNSVNTYSLMLRHGGAPGDVMTCTDSQGNASWQPAEGQWESGTGGEIYYNGGNVGIGVANPNSPLAVNGQIDCTNVYTNWVDTNSFLLREGGAPGYVLTCIDSQGNADWQPDLGGLTLPYEGSASSSGSAFKVTNSGTSQNSHAIHGVIDNASGDSDAAAGYFDARGADGHAIVARSDETVTIDARNEGTGNAIYAAAVGYAAGKFYGRGDHGHGIETSSIGEFGNGLYASASGGGAAIVAEPMGASTIGLVSYGTSKAAKFYGNVALYEYGTTNRVLELGKGLDYAEGFDITEAEDEDVPAGTVLVIDANNPGRLTQCAQAYDRKVAGIVAGAKGLGSGVRLGGGDFDRDVALAGRVYCNVIALDGDIQPGDLLTTASTPGYAMKVADHNRAQGAILGKAMERLAKGERGQILVLVTLQ